MDIKMIAAAAALAIAPAVAGAVVIPNDSTAMVGVGEGINADGGFVPASSPAGSTFWGIEATEVLKLTNGMYTFLNAASVMDEKVTIEINDVMVDMFTPSMMGSLDNYVLASGDVLEVIFSWSGSTASPQLGNFDFTYLTTPIPLPAAGWMFLSALAGMGFLARRRAA
jgi:hypothetical protein